MRSPVALSLLLLVSGLAWAGVSYGPGRTIPSNTLEGPLEVNGSVTMNTGPMTINGPTTAGPTVTLRGPTTTTGSFAFGEPPSGLTRKGVLTRGAALGLAVGCQTLGTVSVAGSGLTAACAVTQRPAAILNLGIVLDCYVTAPGTVTVRACALVALLSAPSGDYGVTLVGE